MRTKQKENVFKTDKETHAKVVSYCKKQGNKIYVWVSKTLLQAIEKGGHNEGV